MNENGSWKINDNCDPSQENISNLTFLEFAYICSALVLNAANIHSEYFLYLV
jgi:hypothetical protein